MIEDYLEYISVRIEEKNGSTIGSGVLWINPQDEKYVYIFTAGHVIKDKDKGDIYDSIKICIKKGDGFVIEDINYKDIKYHNKFEYKNDRYESDIAIIRSKRKDFMNSGNYKPIILGEVERMKDIVGRGFPISGEDKSFKLSGNFIRGNICNDTDLCTQRFQINISESVNSSKIEEELPGYSGSGIFCKSESGEELTLLGILSHGQGMSGQSTVNCYDTKLILDICTDNAWDSPENSYHFPQSFENNVNSIIRKIDSPNIKTLLEDSINEMIYLKKITPIGLMEQHNDCYDIPKCNSRNKTRCNHRWESKLKLLSILNIMGVKEKNFQMPIVSFKSNHKLIDVPIEFVCSEGENGDCTITKLIRSLVREEFMGKFEFRDEGIIIWSSDEIPTKKIYKKCKMPNIISDISNDIDIKKELYKSGKGIDIIDGEIKINNFSIIHIHKLMEDIDLLDDADSRSDIVERVEELIIDVIGK